MNDDIVVFKQLDDLKEQHRQLDDEIRALQLLGSPDEMQVARLKKRKLQLRDQIMTLEVEIYPDQPA
ncbi:MAG: YdcH family protein [Rickettsiales bacterium]|nr:YdcH family protein [Rickettsiales bacterium]